MTNPSPPFLEKKLEPVRNVVIENEREELRRMVREGEI